MPCGIQIHEEWRKRQRSKRPASVDAGCAGPAEAAEAARSRPWSSTSLESYASGTVPAAAAAAAAAAAVVEPGATSIAFSHDE